MQLFECDFCRQQKQCKAIKIDATSFDICADCKGELDKKLEGRGSKMAESKLTILQQFAGQFAQYLPLPPPSNPRWPDDNKPIYLTKLSQNSGGWNQ